MKSPPKIPISTWIYPPCTTLQIFARNVNFKERRHSVSATNSSFLMNTPAEALLFATRFSAFRHHHYTQTPPSILNRRRYQPNFLYKPSAIIRAATTSMPLRGDQHPQIDDDVTIETIDDQRGNNSSRHTIMPVYFTHDRDTTVAQRT